MKSHFVIRLTFISFFSALSLPAPLMAQEPSPQIENPSPTSAPPILKSQPEFDMKMLEPINGVDLRTYSHITYAMFLDPDGDHEAIFKRFGVEKADFEAASAGFGERMRQDRSFVFVEMFGAYFAENAEGKYAALGRDVAQSVINNAPLKEAEPMPEEKFREIQAYYSRKASVAGTELSKQDEVLAPYHITFNDFNILGAWFSRRLKLETADLVNPRETNDTAAYGPPKERPEWGGEWRFTWKTLQRTGEAMKVVETSRDICVKDDMTAETLPLMPKPERVKCVLIDKVHFYETGIHMRAECDLGGVGASWGLYLNPENDGESFTGQISYNETYEGDTDMPQPATDVTVKRVGDCK